VEWSSRVFTRLGLGCAQEMHQRITARQRFVRRSTPMTAGGNERSNEAGD
jgi:hypothetical protein